MPKFIDAQFMILTEVGSTIGKKERIYVDSGSVVPCVRAEIGVIETYQAKAAGFKPSIKIKIRECEFSETFKAFKVNDIRYKIIRTQNAYAGFVTIVGEALNQ